MRDQFEFFMGTLADIRGKTIIEIGPGDTIALGLQFLTAGAAAYVAFDRFQGDVFGTYAQELYRLLGCDLDGLRNRISLRPHSIEDAPPEKPFADVVVSFDVVEHLRDPHQAFARMASMLKREGVMVHRIDYSPHDVWRSYPNPLTFLTIPPWLWSAMGSNRGYPNRERHAAIMQTLRSLGFNVDQRVTSRATDVQFDAVRSSLPPRFAKLSREDMLVLVAEVACSRAAASRLGPKFPY